jgi:hypothetical protein
LDDFGIKYIGKQHLYHLITSIKRHYDEITQAVSTLGSHSTGTTTAVISTSPCLDMSPNN